jgi:hypothetical protein
MRTKVETVTPKMARKWLEASEGFQQRGMRERLVAKLTHAIESDQWQITHQGIAIAEGGIVLDGQHRLTAIVRADMPVQMMVTRDADPAMFGVIDTGTARTPADSLRIAGYKNTNVLAAVVRALIVYEQVAGTQASNWKDHDRAVTTGDLLSWLEVPEQHDAAQQAIVDANRAAGSIARHGATSPLATALLYVMTQPTDITPTIRSEFYQRLADGVLLGPRSPILSLRRWLIGDSGYILVPSSQRRILTIANTIKAMNDYALGNERALTVFRLGSEPLPKPIAPGAVIEQMMMHEAELIEREGRERIEA